jgi:hypothetical protein
MSATLQYCFTNRKKHSLVLNGLRRHHGDMNQTTTTRTHTSHGSRTARLRTFLKYAWGDQVAAHRALLRTPPYDDYLFNRRDER